MSGYALIDFGRGRKLESLAGYIVDRPSPSAIGASRAAGSEAWTAADAVFCETQRRWLLRRPWPDGISLCGGSFSLPFRPTPFGHIGCFPEQLPHWRWLAEQVTALAAAGNAPPQALNLFAHTGGSTLAMAAAGASVAHVDAAKPSVTAARAAAAHNALDQRPIRYLVEDAARYVARELRRGRRYDLVVLDPPSYGHAPGGKAWRIERDLWPLLDDALRLLSGPRWAMLITGHSEHLDQHRIADYLRQRLAQQRQSTGLRLQLGRSELTDCAGRTLDAGFFVRALSDGT